MFAINELLSAFRKANMRANSKKVLDFSLSKKIGESVAIIMCSTVYFKIEKKKNWLGVFISGIYEYYYLATMGYVA